MTDEPDEGMERWLRDVVAPAVGNAVAFDIPVEDARRQLADDDGSLTGGLVTPERVADLLRTTQPTRIAPPEWTGKVLEVVTESGSRYVIDTIDWTLTRIRGRDEQQDPEVAPASVMRRDGETLRLLRVLTLEVASRAVMDVEPLRPDAVWTRRTTTFVVDIRQVG